jgi:putative inorganic carbon (HCO3(-)) transporter
MAVEDIAGEPAQPSTGADLTSSRLIPGATLAIVVLVPLVTSNFTPGSDDLKPLLFTLFVALGMGVWVVGGPVRGQWAWPMTRANLPLLVFLGLSLLSFAISPFFRASSMEVWRLAGLAGVYFLGLHVARRKAHVAWTVRTIALTAGVVALYGIMQRFGADLLGLEGYHTSGRSNSLCGHPNLLASYLVFTLPLTAALFLSAGSRKALALWGADFALQAMCLVFTFSRAGWIGALVGSIVFVSLLTVRLRPRKVFTKEAARHWILAGVVVTSLGVAFAVGSSYSAFTSKRASLGIETRKLIYKGDLRMFAARPVFGHGIGTFQTKFPEHRPSGFVEADARLNVYHAHSEYLEIATETGVIGLGVFLWFLYSVLRSGRSAWTSAGEARRSLVLAGLLAAVAGTLSHGIASVNLRMVIPASHVWLALGLLAGAPPTVGMRVLRSRRSVAAGAAAILVIGGGVLCYRMSVSSFASRIHERKGNFLENRGEWRAAIDEYDRSIDIDPWNLSARYERAICLVELDQHGDVVTAYREIEAFAPNYVHIHYNMGLAHALRNDWEEAVRSIERADASGSLPAGFPLEEALALLRSDRSDAEKGSVVFAIFAESRFRDEARLRGVELDDLAEEISAKGSKYYVGGQLDRATALFELALSVDPDNRAVLNNLAGIRFQRGEYDEAIVLCERLLEVDPGDAHVATNLAKAWLLKRNEAKAEVILRQVLSMEPGYPGAVQLLEKISAGRHEGGRPSQRR